MQVWYADDATAGASLKHLKEWWDHIVELGPDYGYHPNATKTWLIVKRITLKKPKTNSKIREYQSQQKLKDILERLLAHHNLSLVMSNIK